MRHCAKLESIIDFEKLKRLYGRLVGLKELCYSEKYIRTESIGDYNLIVDQMSENIGEDLSSFKQLGIKGFPGTDGKETNSRDLLNKLLQMINYLEYGFHLVDYIIEIGSLYNAINDEELKARCSDILSAPSKFDRVINQATLVLEDRLRTVSKSDKSLIGVNLVNKVLNPDITKSIIKTSENNDEHEGICNICRGIMQTFRNPSHHRILENIKREDALKITGIVDILLSIIGKSNTK